MKVHDGLEALGDAPADRRAAVLVGVFDGVHLGHQRLLHELLELASELEAEPTIVTFANHPDELLRGRHVEWITSLQHRLRLLRRAGVQRALVLRFDAALRELSARAFTERILVAGLRTKGLLIGYDSAIGREREGAPARMRELGDEFGFHVREGSLFEVDGKPVSSSAIRAAIQSGDLALAERMLGRWPAAFGKVVRGAGRGKGLGFPTANVEPQSLVLPPSGVYAVEAIHDGETYGGVANLGVRPTFGREEGVEEAGVPQPVLEVHLFDFAGELYGHHLEVGFLQRLREERRFRGVEELRAQIGKDVERARAIVGG